MPSMFSSHNEDDKFGFHSYPEGADAINTFAVTQSIESGCRFGKK